MEIEVKRTPKRTPKPVKTPPPQTKRQRITVPTKTLEDLAASLCKVIKHHNSDNKLTISFNEEGDTFRIRNCNTNEICQVTLPENVKGETEPYDKDDSDDINFDCAETSKYLLNYLKNVKLLLNGETLEIYDIHNKLYDRLIEDSLCGREVMDAFANCPILKGRVTYWHDDLRKLKNNIILIYYADYLFKKGYETYEDAINSLIIE